MLIISELREKGLALFSQLAKNGVGRGFDHRSVKITGKV